MDLWQLEVFKNVVDLKSFSRAGEAVHISQPTVSSHIKDLEAHFSCSLIDRLGREAVPTKAGILLYSYAARLLSMKEETESAISDFLGSIKGELLLGGSTIPAGYIIPRTIGPFAAKFPEISINMMAGDTAAIIASIVNGEIEAGIVGARSNDPRIVQEKLIDDEMKLVVPATHKWASKHQIRCTSLFREPFIAREEGSGTWKSISESIAKAGFSTDSLRIIARMGNTAAVIQGIINHAGVSILSTIAVEDAVQAGRLKTLPVKELNLKRCFYLTTHGKRTLSPISRTFLEFIKDFYKKPE